MEFFSKTDIGKKRLNNEDSIYSKKYNENTALFIVADGLGGYSSGEVASQILTKSISEYIEEHLKLLEEVSDKKINDTLSLALKYANNEIYELEKTDSKYEGMGTTVVLVLFINNKIYYLSVGDSRLYYLDEKYNSIEQITCDDTYVNELVNKNVITKEEAVVHSQKHILTKAVGILKNIFVDVKTLNKKNGSLILCSDGLTNMLNDEEILVIFKKNSFEYVVDKLIAKANSNGGVDNITIATVKF